MLRRSALATIAILTSGCIFFPCSWKEDEEKCLEESEAANASDEAGDPGEVFYAHDENASLAGGVAVVGIKPAGANGYRDYSACPHASPPFPCGRTTTSPSTGPLCVVCFADTDLATSTDPHRMHNSDTWPICERTVGPYTTRTLAQTVDTDLGATGWMPECFLPEQEIADCRPIHVSQSTGDVVNVQDRWTCRCSDDLDCPAGFVCEGGYVWKGALSQPTFCIEPADLQSGPEAYGATSWAEIWEPGVDSVRFVKIPTLGQILNDDQAFVLLDQWGTGAAIEVERCGPRSLCAALGFVADTTLTVEIAVGGIEISSETSVLAVSLPGVIW